MAGKLGGNGLFLCSNYLIISSLTWQAAFPDQRKKKLISLWSVNKSDRVQTTDAFWQCFLRLSLANLYLYLSLNLSLAILYLSLNSFSCSQCFFVLIPISAKFNCSSPTDGPTDQQTDTLPYRDATPHQKRSPQIYKDIGGAGQDLGWWQKIWQFVPLGMFMMVDFFFIDTVAPRLSKESTWCFFFYGMFFLWWIQLLSDNEWLLFFQGSFFFKQFRRKILFRVSICGANQPGAWGNFFLPKVKLWCAIHRLSFLLIFDSRNNTYFDGWPLDKRKRKEEMDE